MESLRVRSFCIMLIERDESILLFLGVLGKRPEQIGGFVFPAPLRNRLDQQNQRFATGGVLNRGTPFVFGGDRLVLFA